jgi:hypothetical protein
MLACDTYFDRQLRCYCSRFRLFSPQSQVQHVTVPDTGVVTVNFVLKPAGKSVAIQ